MSTWVAPITWSNGAVTAAQMNGLRDNLTFLKGALDLVTNSTTADTGTATYLAVTRAASTSQVIQGAVSGDTHARWYVTAAGDTSFGSGSAARDITLGRSSYASKTQLTVSDAAATVGAWLTLTAYGAATLESRSGLAVRVSGDTGYRGILTNTVDGSTQLPGLLLGDGSTTDTNLYRSAADTLKTDDGVYAVGGIVTKTKAGTPTDADLVTGMQQNGAIIVDTSALKIWVRTGSATWKSVTLT